MLEKAETPEGAQEYFEKYVYGVRDFDEYLERAGGFKMLNYLMRVMQFRNP